MPGFPKEDILKAQEGSPMLVGAEAHRPGRAKILGDRDVLFWAPRPLRVRQRHLFGL